jgi:glycosyltransferase involved in cell wall biosynthesis
MKPTIAVVEGQRQTVLNLYSQFKRSDVHYVAGGDNPLNIAQLSLPSHLSVTNITLKKIFPLDPAQLISKGSNNLSWKYLPGLENHLKTANIVGISDTYYFWNYQTARYAKKNNIPLYTIVWCNMPNHFSKIIPPYSFMTKEIIQNTSLFILRNNEAYKFTDSLNIPREKTKMIYAGVDLNHFGPRKYSQTPDSIVKILFVGSLIKAKGILDIIHAFTELYETHKNIELIIAGAGPMEKTIQKYATEYPITYTKFVDYKNLPELYQQADIFCSPSKTQKPFGLPIHREFFPYTALEAQASALPIITSNVGGLPEAVGENNIIIEEANTEQLKNAIEKLVTDQTLRQKIGLHNRTRAESLFDVKKQSQLTEDAILMLS